VRRGLRPYHALAVEDFVAKLVELAARAPRESNEPRPDEEP
jgi:hypothetical protein